MTATVAHHGRRLKCASAQQSKPSPPRLSFYTDAPSHEITLEQFGSYATDRLTVLQCLSAAKDNKTSLDVPLRDSKTHLDANEQVDTVGHHILRLAFSRTEDSRAWFVQHEALLFQYRWQRKRLERDFADEFVQRHIITDDDIKFVQHVDPIARAAIQELSGQEPSRVYCVPWRFVPSLVAARKVYLRAGIAYVTSAADLGEILVRRFKTSLLNAMRRIANVNTDDRRLRPILNMLAKRQKHVTASETKLSTTITAVLPLRLVPQLAKTSMPLCMKTLHDTLVKKGHLKYGGRTQLALYLKGAGLSLNDALAYWKLAMSRVTSADKFDKEYAYNIRHNYGQEGARKQYTPQSCARIINQTVAEGEAHGCPFRHSSNLKFLLADELQQRGIAQPGNDVNALLKLVSEHKYQIACRRFFELAHRTDKPADEVGNHPNVYTNTSLASLSQKK
jgi:DNA primase large subunit